MSKVTIDLMVERWESSSRPLFKGKLISDDNCCCAQGDVLLCSGRSFDDLRSMNQSEADREVARILGISRAQAILLRVVNDSRDGCPQDVLTNPENVIGPEASRVLRFWAKLDRMTFSEWKAVTDTVTGTARARADAVIMAAAKQVVGEAARDEAWQAARDGAWQSAGDEAWQASKDGAWQEAGDAARDAAVAAAKATNEIQGHTRLDKLLFLPMFGIHKIEDLDQLD